MAERRKAYPPPFSLRLTFEERAALEKAAGDMPLGAYIRSCIFDDDAIPRRMRGKRPVKDYKALGHVLGKLGQSRLADNLNQLACAANTGSLAVTPDTEAALVKACEEIKSLRSDLICALGLSAGVEP